MFNVKYFFVSCFYTKLGITHVHFQIFLLFSVKDFAMNMICHVSILENFPEPHTFFMIAS